MDTGKMNLDIEKDLDEILNPIQPSSDFVDDLNQKLRKNSQVVIENPNYLFPIVVLSTGLFIGIAIIWLLNKIFRFITSSNEE